MKIVFHGHDVGHVMEDREANGGSRLILVHVFFFSPVVSLGLFYFPPRFVFRFTDDFGTSEGGGNEFWST